MNNVVSFGSTKLPCHWCHVPTPHEDLATFGARCQSCFNRYCGDAVRVLNAMQPKRSPVRPVPASPPPVAVGAALAPAVPLPLPLPLPVLVSLPKPAPTLPTTRLPDAMAEYEAMAGEPLPWGAE